MKFDIAELH